jgi:hypothetical protein
VRSASDPADDPFQDTSSRAGADNRAHPREHEKHVWRDEGADTCVGLARVSGADSVHVAAFVRKRRRDRRRWRGCFVACSTEASGYTGYSELAVQTGPRA